MCGPKAGTASMRGVPLLHEPGGSREATGSAEVSTAVQRPRAWSCGWDHTGHGVDLVIGDLRGFQTLHHLGRGQPGEGLDDLLLLRRAQCHALGVAGIPLVGGQFRLLQNLFTKRFRLTFVLQA